MTATPITEAGRHSVTVPTHPQLRLGTLDAIMTDVAGPPRRPEECCAGEAIWVRPARVVATTLLLGLLILWDGTYHQSCVALASPLLVWVVAVCGGGGWVCGLSGS